MFAQEGFSEVTEQMYEDLIRGEGSFSLMYHMSGDVYSFN